MPSTVPAVVEVSCPLLADAEVHTVLAVSAGERGSHPTARHGGTPDIEPGYYYAGGDIDNLDELHRLALEDHHGLTRARLDEQLRAALCALDYDRHPITIPRE